MISSTDEQLNQLFKDLIVTRLTNAEFWEWTHYWLSAENIIDDAIDEFENAGTEEKIEQIEFIAKKFIKHRKQIKKELMVIKL